MIDSACTAMLQLHVLSDSAVDITAKPLDSALSCITSGATPSWCAIEQPAPYHSKTLWFQAGGPVSRVKLCPGWSRTAMAYGERSMLPRSTRTMYGTVLPWSVVVVATSVGGLLGSYG